MFLRSNSHDVLIQGYRCLNSGNPEEFYGKDVIITDCEFGATRSSNLWTSFTRNLAFMGNWVHDAGHHNMYTVDEQKTLFSHNTIERAGDSLHNLRISGQQTWAPDYPEGSKYVCVLDNVINANTWLSLHIAPNTNTIQNIEHVLVERNRIFNADFAVGVQPGDAHVRIVNNILGGRLLFSTSGAAGGANAEPIDITSPTTLLSRMKERRSSRWKRPLIAR